MTIYYHATVRGRKLFCREAGPRDAPTIVLLHGFPSSSHMFRHLIPQLADKFHVIAPDYVGFGYSDAPNANEFEYTFNNLAAHVEELLFEVLGLKKFSIYVQDYGAPVGYRIASKHQDAIEGIVVQNGNAYVDGIGGAFDPMKPSGSIGTWRRRSRYELYSRKRPPFSSTRMVSRIRSRSVPMPIRLTSSCSTGRAMMRFSSIFYTTTNRTLRSTTAGTSTSATNSRGC